MFVCLWRHVVCMCMRTRKIWYTCMYTYIWKNHLMYTCLLMYRRRNVYIYMFIYKTHMIHIPVCMYKGRSTWCTHVCVHVKDTTDVHVCLCADRRYVIYRYIDDKTHVMCIYVYTHMGDTYTHVCIHVMCIHVCMYVEALRTNTPRGAQRSILDDWNYSCFIWFICSSVFLMFLECACNFFCNKSYQYTKVHFRSTARFMGSISSITRDMSLVLSEN